MLQTNMSKLMMYEVLFYPGSLKSDKSIQVISGIFINWML